MEQSRSIGADEVIDYTKENFTKSNKHYDLIIAINGNYPLSAYRRILNHGGIYVMVGGALVQIFKSLLFGRLMSFGSKKMFTLTSKSDQQVMELIVKLVAEGKIKLVIDKRYSLEQTPEAMWYVNEGHAGGKVMINVQ